MSILSGKISRKISLWLSLSTLAMAIVVMAFPVTAQQIQSSNEETQSTKINNNNFKGVRSFKESKSKTDKAEAPAPPPSGYNWSGGYIGAHAGYGWGKADTDFDPRPDAATFVNLAPTTLKLRPKGFNGGVQGGYNWQFGNLVVGGELDYTWSDMRQTRTVSPIVQNNGTPFPGAGYITATQKTEWVGTVRPRIGAAFGKFLIYGTAGLAYGRIKNIANVDFRPFGTVQYPAIFSKTQAGWVVGGGMEIGIIKHLSIKSEYLYYDLGRTNFVANPTPALPPFQVAYSWQTKAQTWNAGFNFRF